MIVFATATKTFELTYPEWFVTSGGPEWGRAIIILLGAIQDMLMPVAYALFAFMAAWAMLSAGFKATEGNISGIFSALLRIFVFAMILHSYDSVFSFWIRIGGALDNVVYESLTEQTETIANLPGLKDKDVIITHKNLGIPMTYVHRLLVGKAASLFSIFDSANQAVGTFIKASISPLYALTTGLAIVLKVIIAFIVLVIALIVCLLPIISFFSMYFVTIFGISILWTVGPCLVAFGARKETDSYFGNWLTNLIKLLLFFPVYRIVLAFILVLLYTIDLDSIKETLLAGNTETFSFSNIPALIAPGLIMVGIVQSLIGSGIAAISGLLDQGLSQAYSAASGAASSTVQHANSLRKTGAKYGAKGLGKMLGAIYGSKGGSKGGSSSKNRTEQSRNPAGGTNQPSTPSAVVQPPNTAAQGKTDSNGSASEATASSSSGGSE